ncbi:ApeP family dehydratase [Aliamphritea ceti]|uniref:ApeP family dehydratase n=1 Tax=Aliamphritea ceti TaxID=1524258 RepID=UPI0021C257CC|nr:hypothetical protein [Aliamphritea ceti]
MSEYSVAELVPHSGKMSLLDEIVAYGDDWLEAHVNIHSGAMFADESGVPGWVGMEYLAQAIGAYAGVQERAGGKVPKLGFLLGSRKYECSTDKFLHGQTLLIRVEKELQAENGLSSFNCLLSSENVTAEARLNVFQPEDADVFLKEMA